MQTTLTPLENRLQQALSDALDRLEALEPDKRHPAARKVLAEAAQWQMQEAGHEPEDDALAAIEILDERLAHIYGIASLLAERDEGDDCASTAAWAIVSMTREAQGAAARLWAATRTAEAGS